MTTARTVLQTNGLIVNARLKSEKPVMPDLDLRELMTIKINTFTFKKGSLYKSAIAEKKNKYKRSVHQEIFSNKENSRKFCRTSKSLNGKLTLEMFEITAQVSLIKLTIMIEQNLNLMEPVCQNTSRMKCTSMS